VVIGSAGEIFFPWSIEQGLVIIDIGQPFNVHGGELPEHLGKNLILFVVSGTVEFKVFEQQKHLFKMVDGQAVIYGVEGMGNDIDDVFTIKIGYQIKDIFSNFPDLIMLGFGDILGQHMHLATIFGEIGGDLLGDIGIRQMGNFKGTLDGVVVGYGHKGHTLCLGCVIYKNGFREAFRTADFLKNPLGRSLGKFGVHMKVYFNHFLSLLIIQ